jgi:hypothetical protein
MSSEDRLRRLRELIARIEQLPPSAETERMLREVRARVVDVDTGATPRAMLPVDPVPPPATDAGRPMPQAPQTVAGTRADPAPARRKPVPAAPPTKAAGLSAAEDREWLALMATNEVLSLDDSGQLPSSDKPRDARDRRPWRRGLRG